MPSHRDKAQVYDIFSQIDRGIQIVMGVRGAFSLKEIQTEMEEDMSINWDNKDDKVKKKDIKAFVEEFIERGIQILEEGGRERLKGRRYTPSPNKESGIDVAIHSNFDRSDNKITANSGLIWATIDPEIFQSARILLDKVEQCRCIFWGQAAPLFNFQDLGDAQSHKSAHLWMKEQQVRDEAQHEKSTRLVFTLTLDSYDIDFLEFVRLQREVNHTYGSFCLEVDYYKFNRRETDTKTAFGLICTALKGIEEKISFTALNFNTERRTVNLIDEKRESRALDIGPHGVLPCLLDWCADIANISGWWDADQALGFVLTGRPPGAKAGYTTEIGPKFQKFSITATGPLREEDVLNLYQRVCKTSGWKPPYFTETDLALLEIHAHSPGASWPQIHQTWKAWRKRHPELTDFEKKNSSRAPSMMAIAWRRAREKVHGYEREKQESVTTASLPERQEGA